MSRFDTQGTTNTGSGSALTALFCTQIQRALIEFGGANTPEHPYNRTPVGTLDAVSSGYNKQGVSMLPITDGQGRIREVQLNYLQRPGVSEFSDSNDNSACVPTKSYEPLVVIEREVYPLESPVFRVTEEEFHQICVMDLPEWRQRLMSHLMDPFMEALNIRLITQLAANFGAHYGTNNPAAVDVNMINNQAPNVYGFAQLKNEYRKIRGVGRPIVIGTDAVGDYMTMIQEGCCNYIGLNLAASMGQAYFFRDENIPDILGAEHFAVISPGSVQMVTWQKNKGQFEKFGDEFAFTTITEPVTGVEMDVEVIYDKCARAYNTLLRVWWGLFVLPDDMYAPGSPMSRVNGTLRFRATIT